MLALNNLKDKKLARKSRIRVGRGIGCGKGKTCGRGVKGQKARTGVSINGFEGGQTPIYRRLPKRGFVNIFRREYTELSLQGLQAALDKKLITGDSLLTEAVLLKAKVVTALKHGIRLIGKGDLTEKVLLEISGISANAKAAVERQGGSVKLLVSNKKVVE